MNTDSVTDMMSKFSFYVDSSGLMAQSGSSVTSGVATDASAADYLERLKMLRARCGLDNISSRTDSSLSAVAIGVTKSDVSVSRVLDGDISAVSILALVLF